jgi:hypothetical protein
MNEICSEAVRAACVAFAETLAHYEPQHQAAFAEFRRVLGLNPQVLTVADKEKRLDLPSDDRLLGVVREYDDVKKKLAALFADERKLRREIILTMGEYGTLRFHDGTSVYRTVHNRKAQTTPPSQYNSLEIDLR